MELLNALILSLSSPMVLAFVLGIIASAVKSDLRIPPDIYSILTIYLLFAIGLKGGSKLIGLNASEVGLPLLTAIGLSLCIPLKSA